MENPTTGSAFGSRKKGAENTDRDRAEKALRSYAAMAGFDERDEDMDLRNYGMVHRLELADIVAADGGGKTVADLGSQYGGMTHALKECGIRTVSTEYLDSHCKRYLNGVNDGEVVRCDSFHLPLRNLDALVSYMFLGAYVPVELRKGRGLGEVFDELSRSAGAIYSVEPQSEYSAWLGGREIMGADEIEVRLREELPDFEVEPLGKFGTYKSRSSFFPEKRLGFRFTRKENGARVVPKPEGIRGRILSLFSGKKL